MARNVRMWWEELGKKPSYILKDWDTKFTAQFDAILESTGGTVKRISRQALNMNPFCEAWIGSLERECLNKFVVFGEGHLQHIAGTYVAYHNSVRPHSGSGNEVVGDERPTPEAVEERDGVVCESWLGGPLRHYRRAAA
ncbi:MAG: integrase core domain-containing protein [Planctomycetota bacterium]